MSPTPATILTPKLLYLYLIFNSPKTPNPLTTIPAHQPQQHHHRSLYIFTFLTTSTINMSNETFKSSHGCVPTLTKENCPIWKQKMHRVLIAKKVYNIVTRVKLLPLGNGVALPAIQEFRYDRANKAIALIQLECCHEPLPHIDNVDDPVEMWEALRDWVHNAATTLGRTQVLGKFTACRLSWHKRVTQYFTKPPKISPMTPWRHTSSLPYLILIKRPSKSLNSESPPPQPSSVWMRSINTPSKWH